jgi:hypothetical protein
MLTEGESVNRHHIGPDGKTVASPGIRAVISMWFRLLEEVQNV